MVIFQTIARKITLHPCISQVLLTMMGFDLCESMRNKIPLIRMLHATDPHDSFIG
ncbi:MAG: hypothetical protein ABGX37_01910 [Methylococcales bacterium]|jgi:hypothetical protein